MPRIPQAQFSSIGNLITKSSCEAIYSPLICANCVKSNKITNQTNSSQKSFEILNKVKDKNNLI